MQQTSVVFPELCPCLCLCGPCASPACSPCLALLVLGCQELFFALPCLLMLGLPCLLSSLSPAHVLCHVAREFYFQKISFLFVLPFCGCTKRVGPFVLPQKGRPVPSLFLFYPSADFRSLVLRPPTGAISVERVSSGFGYGGGIGQGRFQNFGP